MDDSASKGLPVPGPSATKDPSKAAKDGEKKKKTPRRLIHYVDGSVEEEYSSDEEEPPPPPPPPVDTSTLSWPGWMWHYTKVSGVKSLAAADYCGEKLAWFFGITSPKYQYVIDEYHRLKVEEKEEQEREEYEMNEYLKQKGAQSEVMESGGLVTKDEESSKK